MTARSLSGIRPPKKNAIDRKKKSSVSAKQSFGYPELTPWNKTRKSSVNARDFAVKATLKNGQPKKISGRRKTSSGQVSGRDRQVYTWWPL